MNKDPGESTSELIWLTCIFLAVVCEGALRKWVLPAIFHPAAFLAKDILAILYIIRHQNTGKYKYGTVLELISYGSAILLSVAFVLGLINSWQSAIITYKNAVLWPLVAGSIATNSTRSAWKSFSAITAVIAVMMFVLGIKQFFSAPSAAINNYAWVAAGVASATATFGGLQGVRATGTFSYIAGMSEFAVFGFVICVFHTLERTTRRYKILLIVGCAASFGCAAVSGSRAPLVFMGLTSIMFLVMNTRTASQFVRLCFYAGIGIIVATLMVNNGVMSEYLGRWTRDPDETLHRLAGPGLQMNYLEMIYEDPVGIGLGQGHGYAVYEKSRTNAVSFLNYSEDNVTLAILEGGLLGGIAFCLAPCAIALEWFKGLTNRDRRMRSVSAAFGTAPLVMLVLGVWNDHNATAFVWLLIAAWFALARQTQGETAAPVRRGWSDSQSVLQ